MKALQRSCLECDAEQVDYIGSKEPFNHARGCVEKPTPTRRTIDACPDCGEEGESIGHSGCQSPQDP